MNKKIFIIRYLTALVSLIIGWLAFRGLMHILNPAWRDNLILLVVMYCTYTSLSQLESIVSKRSSKRPQKDLNIKPVSH
jgi:hypothetical protein